MQSVEIQPPFASDVTEVARRLGTDCETGLLPEDAKARFETYGPNILRRQKRRGILSILRHQLEGLIVWLLIAATVVSFAFGDFVEAVAIVVVLLINGTIGFVTELKAERSMEALMRFSAPRTRVRRGGQDFMLGARHLVPGDIVLLEAGDMVTADLRLASAWGLRADESALTGESVPASKSVAPVDAQTPLADQSNMAFKGTAITRGAGTGIVVGTGMDTEIGRISELVQSAKPESDRLELHLDRLGQRLVWLTLALALLTIGAGVLRGNDIETMIHTGVVLAVAAVPEGLPVVATLSLARGAWRMSARNALIKRLGSVGTLGATTIILTDKTGTLTENRMTVVKYLLDSADIDVDLRDADGPFQASGQAIWPEDDPGLAWALRVGALCNTVHSGNGPDAEHLGDPMEIALLSVGDTFGFGREALHSNLPEAHKHAFDPERTMMATVHADGDTFFFAVKGAPETVLAACSRVMLRDGTIQPVTDATRKHWLDRNATAAQDGLRLLALAMKHDSDRSADPYHGLVLIGLVCLLDPLRDGVREAIAASRAAGVRVVMLTGDHAETARTIAKQAGLAKADPVVIEGRELAGIDISALDDDMRHRILQADVFARVTPETKLMLATIYQQAGHVVAMTGDGVNDAPALKKADIGIAMGLRGTEVAKEAALMVLRDDAFASIIAAMRQGRVIFDNIRKFAVYLISCNASEVLVVGLAVGGGLPTPLLPLQILYLNLITDVFPAFALGLGQGDDNVMKKPPHAPNEPILGQKHWLLISALGGAITLATLGAFGLSLFWLNLSTGPSITVAFVTLALAQLWNVFNVRDSGAGPIRNDVTRNPMIWGAIALCVGLIALALWLPALSGLLRLESPGWAGLGLALGASVLPVLLGQLWVSAWQVRTAARRNHAAGTTPAS